MTKEEKFVKKLIKKESFEEVKKMIQIGDRFEDSNIVIGFYDTSVVFVSKENIKQGKLKEQRFSTMGVFTYLYSTMDVYTYLYKKLHSESFYNGYDVDSIVNLLKCKMQNEWLRSLSTEMQQVVYDKIFDNSFKPFQILHYFIFILLTLEVLFGFITLTQNLESGLLMIILGFGTAVGFELMIHMVEDAWDR